MKRLPLSKKAHQELYLKLVLQYGEVCAICGRPPLTRRLHIDHNHKTGKVRGLLCYYDNKYVVGRLSLEKARAIVKYLETYDVSEQTEKRGPNSSGAHPRRRKAPHTGRKLAK